MSPENNRGECKHYQNQQTAVDILAAHDEPLRITALLDELVAAGLTEDEAVMLLIDDPDPRIDTDYMNGTVTSAA